MRWCSMDGALRLNSVSRSGTSMHRSYEYELIAQRPYDDLLSDIGHSDSVEILRKECEGMIPQLSREQSARPRWAVVARKGSYLLAMVMRDEDGSYRISYFLGFPLEEMEAVYWIADDGEIAELEEELEEFMEDESIDWVGGHLGVASGPLLMRTASTFGEEGLPDVIVGVKIREERATPLNRSRTD